MYNQREDFEFGKYANPVSPEEPRVLVVDIPRNKKKKSKTLGELKMMK